ncbi:restriction endonuclease [Chloroflexia bacterium SDU3-3]|nr:restriction endonuclease [Chloroflexia bacterium SDU3-3]
MTDSTITDIDISGNHGKKLAEAQHILESLGFPAGQRNVRSALTLLALLDMQPNHDWAAASNPPMGITPILQWAEKHYAVRYAPNTRETIRKDTMHHFVEAALAIANPDQPNRPTNSPKWHYRIEPAALALIRTFGTNAWPSQLARYLTERVGLQTRYADIRNMARIPVQIPGGKEITLSPGNHSALIKAIIDEFAPRFLPGSHLIYVGDTGDKWGFFDEQRLHDLGVVIDAHGKMPDVIFYYEAKHWLVLVESLTSRGPVDGKRHDELARLFGKSTAGIVYVTAFPTRKGLARYVTQISWATEVWVAEAADHLIHFDGERFLGPYPTTPKKDTNGEPSA